MIIVLEGFLTKWEMDETSNLSAVACYCTCNIQEAALKRLKGKEENWVDIWELVLQVVDFISFYLY